MQFDSKETTMSAIKHYHITNGTTSLLLNPYLHGTMHPLQQWMSVAFEGCLQQS